MSPRISLCLIVSFCFGLVAMMATPVKANDPLTQARLAAIDGRHGECVTLASAARKQNPNMWQANQVYASCTAIDAQKRKLELGPEAYKARVLDAIEVMEAMIEDESSMTSRQRIQFSYMAIDMRKQLEIDLAEMNKQPR